MCVCYWGTHQLSQPPVNPTSHLLRTSTCKFMPLLLSPLIGQGAWAPFWLRKSSCNVMVQTKNNGCFSCLKNHFKVCDRQNKWPDNTATRRSSVTGIDKTAIRCMRFIFWLDLIKIEFLKFNTCMNHRLILYYYLRQTFSV